MSSQAADERLGEVQAPLLNRRIFDSYAGITGALDEHPDVQRIALGRNPTDGGFRVAPARPCTAWRRSD